jgi:hypothetical protein
MATGTLAIVCSVGGVTVQKTITETGDHPNVYGDGATQIALAAGKAASSWVKDTATTAHCNLTAGHGYSTGKADIFWLGGMRYDVDMVVSTNAVTLSGGAGDNYPESADVTVVICTPQQINTAIDGDKVQLLCINSTVRASVYFEDATGDSIKQIELTADQPHTYAISSGEASPLTGDPITVCYASNGTTTAGVLTILSLEDSTP